MRFNTVFSRVRQSLLRVFPKAGCRVLRLTLRHPLRFIPVDEQVRSWMTAFTVAIATTLIPFAGAHPAIGTTYLTVNAVLGSTLLAILFLVIVYRGRATSEPNSWSRRRHR